MARFGMKQQALVQEGRSIMPENRTGQMTGGGAVDYRTPGVGAHRVQRVAQELALSQSLGAAAALGKLAMGVPLSLVPPLIVAGIVKGVRHRGVRLDLPPFWVVFGLACLAVVPLLMWLERRSRGEFYSDAVRGESSSLEASSYGEYTLQSNKMLGTAVLEVALTGPRLLWGFIDWALQRPGAAGASPIRLTAAELVVELLDAGEGVKVRRLVRPDRPAPDVMRAVDYLLSRDWVGVSRDRDRVWLSTPVRDRLAVKLRQPL
jgi:hypothetical protein